jgi:phage baseplate assembly protein W
MAFKVTELEYFIGKGITLPLKLIRSSIRMILSWTYGTRFFLNEFGSRIEEMLDEPTDRITQSILEDLTRDALERWEKRIELISTEAELDPKQEGKINLEIVYRVKAIDRTDSFVYPFYYQITS